MKLKILTVEPNKPFELQLQQTVKEFYKAKYTSDRADKNEVMHRNSYGMHTFPFFCELKV